MIDEPLLALLRCPVTQQPLTLASPELVRRCREATGQPLEAALLRADGTTLYPIQQGIPVLVADAAIPVAP